MESMLVTFNVIVNKLSRSELSEYIGYSFSCDLTLEVQIDIIDRLNDFKNKMIDKYGSKEESVLS